MVEILPGVHEIDGVNANSYIIIGEDGSLTLIDAGMSKDGKKIMNYLQTNLSKKPSDLKTIVLTHCHIDHVRGAHKLRKATGAKIAIHANDADCLSGKKKMPSPGGAIGILFKILGPFFQFPKAEADQLLNENDNVGSLTVLFTPGHTPGSISLYDQQKKLMFVGDTIRYINGKMEGPPKSFTPDMKEATKSVGKISNFDFEVMLSGHGQPLKSADAQKKVKELYSSLSGVS